MISSINPINKTSDTVAITNDNSNVQSAQEAAAKSTIITDSTDAETVLNLPPKATVEGTSSKNYEATQKDLVAKINKENVTYRLLQIQIANEQKNLKSLQAQIKNEYDENVNKAQSSAEEAYKAQTGDNKKEYSEFLQEEMSNISTSSINSRIISSQNRINSLSSLLNSKETSIYNLKISLSTVQKQLATSKASETTAATTAATAETTVEATAKSTTSATDSITNVVSSTTKIGDVSVSNVNGMNVYSFKVVDGKYQGLGEYQLTDKEIAIIDNVFNNLGDTKLTSGKDLHPFWDALGGTQGGSSGHRMTFTNAAGVATDVFTNDACGRCDERFIKAYKAIKAAQSTLLKTNTTQTA